MGRRDIWQRAVTDIVNRARLHFSRRDGPCIIKLSQGDSFALLGKHELVQRSMGQNTLSGKLDWGATSTCSGGAQCNENAHQSYEPHPWASHDVTGRCLEATCTRVPRRLAACARSGHSRSLRAQGEFWYFHHCMTKRPSTWLQSTSTQPRRGTQLIQLIH